MDSDAKVWELTVVPFKGFLLPDHLQEEIVALNEQAFNWSETFTRNDIANDCCEYYVLFNGSIMLGYVGLHFLDEEATINTFFIDQELRGQGMATLLGRYVVDQLRQRGVRRLFLEVRHSNEAAIHLYKNLGFETLVVRSNYYSNPTEDALIMQQALLMND